MDADRDSLATAPDADDLLRARPRPHPSARRSGSGPRITDAELGTLAVMQALPGRTSDARSHSFSLVDRLARLGWTRIGSPGIFGYSGG